MPSIVFRVRISSDEWLAYYRGTARDVVARAEDGRTVRFPARALHRFLTRDGIMGRFRLDYDESGRLRGVEKLG